ncbi:leucine-rich repeat-containing protein 58-like [Saccoglossus kowalevskii]|uniref:Leucine-rich repeat-containing protein 58-like n=1 Tax=Saccoglossus kowalevskii TaxID=10224 RepID=A0ABM0GRH0_SACKO|nr:PREDICTED: leucine-rich repeat-containing protein 58-like [Saccoglossus kowalevskii]
MEAENDETECYVDFSRLQLEEFPDHLSEKRSSNVRSMVLSHNRITVLPRVIGSFESLIELDMSSNRLKYISDEIVRLPKLKVLVAKNNLLDLESLPKNIGMCPQLEVVNFSGNLLVDFPVELTELQTLKCVYLGGNRIRTLPPELHKLQRLEILYLGGNQLTEIPAEIGSLNSLISLVLCDNKIQQLPSDFVKLTNLESLSLHNNSLTTLPTQIVKLKNLAELSLRGNPLVMRFCRDLTYQPPSLLELSGRAIKSNNVPYNNADLPRDLVHYLGSACKCVNPNCKGVYFESRVEHVKFVDFCGKYRLPLLQYLCSPQCATPGSCSSSESELSEDESGVPTSKIKKVLLG